MKKSILFLFVICLFPSCKFGDNKRMYSEAFNPTIRQEIANFIDYLDDVIAVPLKFQIVL